MKTAATQKNFPEDIGTIISRSWRLYRMNFFSFLSFSLIFSTIVAIGVPVELLFLKNLFAGNYQNIFITGTLELFYFFLLVTSYVFTFIALTRTTYTILCKNKASFIDTFLETSSYFANKTVFFMNLSFEMLLFFIADLIIYFSSFAGITLFMRLANLNFLNYVIFYIGLALINIIMLIIILIEIFLLITQAIIFVLEEKSFIDTLVESFSILFLNLQKTVFFVFVLIFVWILLSAYFFLPVSVVYVFYATPLNKMPLVIYYILTSYINALFMPFFIIGFTLYYYYNKVYTRGLDLVEMITIEKEAC